MKIIDNSKEISSLLYLFKNTLPSLRNGIVNITEFSEKIYKNGYVCVYEENGIQKGFAAFYANDSKNKTGYLSMIAVKDEYRRSNIGRQLLEFVESKSLWLGMNSLQLEVSKSNESAIAFYKKQGYTICSDITLSYYMIKTLQGE